MPSLEGVPAATEGPESIPLEEIRAAIRAVQFGTVQIIIQDGRVIQIEKTEKLRFDRPRTRNR